MMKSRIFRLAWKAGFSALVLAALGGCGKKEAVTFPCALEDNKLSVVSLFPYSGINPDNGDEIGEDIASLEVTNRSGQYLASAQLTARLSDGTELSFQIQDLPAGEKVWVFEKDSSAFAGGAECEALRAETEFLQDEPLLPDQVMVETEGTAVTLTNLQDEPLTGLRVWCRCLFDGVYFGGTAYAYPVEEIPAGESVTLQAEECYLGEAAVVRVSQDS